MAMLDRIYRKEISDKVEYLLRRFDIKRPPVPVDKIVKKLGLLLAPFPADDEISGAIIRKRKPESVKTAAGSFANAEVIDVAETRIWRSPKVPLWGLVQSKSRGQSVELIGYASAGAHTLIQGNGSESMK